MHNSVNRLLKLVIMAFGLIAVGVLGACSSAGLSYPSVGAIDRITQKILTPEERKKAIDDMALENAQLRAKTIETIEKQ